MKKIKLLLIILTITIICGSCSIFERKEYFSSGLRKEKYHNNELNKFIISLINDPESLKNNLVTSFYFEEKITNIPEIYEWFSDYLLKCQRNGYQFEDSYIFDVNNIDKVDEFTTAHRYLELDSLKSINFFQVINIHLQFKDDKGIAEEQKNSIIFTFYEKKDGTIILGTIFPKYWDPIPPFMD